jgi:PAS domain S-box-containing protein
MLTTTPVDAIPALGEVHFRLLVEAAGEAIISADSRGAVVSWNRFAKALFGYEAGAPLGGHLTTLLPGCLDDVAKHDLAGDNGIAIAPRELTGRRRDGTSFPAEVRLSSMVTREGRFTVAMVRDVNRRQKAEESLRASESLYRRIIETTHEGVCIADADYRYTFVNRRLSEMLGYEPGELIGRTVFDLMDDAGGVAQRARMARRREGKPESGELGLRRKDGTEIWVMFESHAILENGQYQGVLSMLMDISERRAIEARLQRSEAQLRQAQAVADIGSWDWDLATNVVTRSEQYQRMLGMEHEDPGMDGTPVYDRIHPEDQERVRREQAQSLRDRRPWICDYRLVLRDGVRLVHTRGDVVVDAAGVPVRLVGTVQDVTEKRKAEARIMLADRMVSVGTLALGVAHEINNPLAYVTANLDMISEEIRQLAGGSPSDRLRELEEMTHEAREGAERVRKIVRGLKSFSRGDEDRPVVLDLRRVLEVAINMAFNEIRHRARLVKDYGEAPPVIADEGRLGQVFINLLVNAAQSFPDGRTERNEIRVRTGTLPDGRALAEVHDTGPGIPPEILGRIFDPFFTTKAVGVGTGLGLSICHGIVTGLGGELTVQSDAQSGTVFRVVLAAAPPVTAAERKHAVSVRPDPGGHASVLIVDDDPMVAKTLARVLRGHEITLTTNGREALELLMTGRRFDVILCDLMMPVMTGMELHAQLAEKLPHVVESIIFLTGGAFTPAGRTFLDEVTNECLEKPFDARNLRSVVQRTARVRVASSDAVADVVTADVTVKATR